MADIILPGTYITVKDEGLISAGPVAAGIIGVVGSIENTEKNKDKMNKVKILGSLSEAEEAFGAKGKWATDPTDAAKNKAAIQKNFTLVRALEQIYRNGGKSVYAVPTATNDSTAYKAGLAALANEIVNIVVLAGQDASDKAIVAELQGHLNSTAQIKRERIGLIGCNGTTDVAAIQKHELNSDRLIYVAPGMTATDVDPATRAKAKLTLTGGYTAAAVAGRISSLPVQSSPTNKTLTLEGLNVDFSSSQLEPLVQKRVLMVEKREGYRIVKGITTATHSAWHQITTRRIVDYALYGVRSSCNPYIGQLNNDRVRGAMRATIDAFLTRMYDDEAIVAYELDVSATRAQEIAGEAIVTMTLKPTFSIDFIKVTMFLG